MADRFIRSLYNDYVGSENVVIRRYPRTSDAAALAPVAVTSGKSYAMGAWAEIVAAAGIAVDYWIVGALMSALVVADEHIFQVGTGGAGSEVMRAEFSIVCVETTAVGERYEHPVRFPIPLKVLANARLAARSAAASANNRASNCAVLCAIGM